jgi:hypothetical protein
VTYFIELHAVDLSSLNPPLADRLKSSILSEGKSPPIETSLLRLLTGYLLVTDKSVREYNAGRATLISYCKSKNQTQLLLEGLGRMETCISSTKRALRFLSRLSSSKSPLAVDRTLRKLAQNPEGLLTSLRDAIEHMDADIVAPGKLKEGEAHLLAIDHAGRTLEIGKHKIALNSLAQAVSALHKTGEQLLAALPVDERAS